MLVLTNHLAYHTFLLLCTLYFYGQFVPKRMSICRKHDKKITYNLPEYNTSLIPNIWFTVYSDNNSPISKRDIRLDMHKKKTDLSQLDSKIYKSIKDVTSMGDILPSIVCSDPFSLFSPQ